MRETKRVGYTSRFAVRARNSLAGPEEILSQADLARGLSQSCRDAHYKEKKVNFRIASIRTTALAAACVLSAGAGWAQSAPAAGAPANGKVGVLNVRQAILSTSEGKQASAELQSQFLSDMRVLGCGKIQFRQSRTRERVA